MAHFTIIIMHHRSKQKQEEKKTAEQEGQLVDKKINQLRSQINQSRTKLDDYLGIISSQVGQIVSHRLSKFVALHSEIVHQKDQEIKELEENNQQAKLSHAGANLERLTKTIAEYEAEIQRLNTIKEMFRKESERFKIELDIKDKELDASKKREKQLMRQIWVLEEDIKDIYQAEPPQKRHSNTKQQYRTPIKKTRNQTQPNEEEGRAKHVMIATQPTQVESKDRMKIKLEDKYMGYKAGLHLGATRLRQKFSVSSQQKRMNSSMKSNTPSINASNVKKSSARAISFSNTKQPDLYEDLRTSLRRASRMKETHSDVWNNEERTLTIDDFRAICLYGPKIMQQIQGIVIEKYGELREIDESSIELLNNLFKTENAVKILQICLFSYSLEAITHIHDHKRELSKQIAYNEPQLEMTPPIEMVPPSRPKKIKMQKQLRKKFKNSIFQRPPEVYSYRASQR